jgi:uncharacterized membrane protein (UPF0136 family)
MVRKASLSFVTINSLNRRTKPLPLMLWVSLFLCAYFLCNSTNVIIKGGLCIVGGLIGMSSVPSKNLQLNFLVYRLCKDPLAPFHCSGIWVSQNCGCFELVSFNLFQRWFTLPLERDEAGFRRGLWSWGCAWYVSYYWIEAFVHEPIAASLLLFFSSVPRFAKAPVPKVLTLASAITGTYYANVYYNA